MFLVITAKNTRDEVMLDGCTVFIDTLERGRVGELTTGSRESCTVVTGIVSGRDLLTDGIEVGHDPLDATVALNVGATLPYATQLRTECLPNIYELANVSDSNVITFTNFDTSNLESNAMVLKVYDEDDTEHLINIAEVVDEHSVRVDEDLSDDKIFVYGQQVDDFHFLKKDAIWTVATSALQEVDRQLQAEKTRNDALEARILALEQKI